MEIKSTHPLDVTLENGKYRLIQDSNGVLYALRHGEQWRSCVGDNLILHLGYELQAAREQLAANRK